MTLRPGSLPYVFHAQRNDMSVCCCDVAVQSSDALSQRVLMH